MENTLLRSIPIVFLGLVSFIYIFLNLRKKGSESIRMDKFFEGHVHNDYLARLKKISDKIDTTGTEKIITIMFIDIRGFTALSEKLSNKKLFKILNQHLSIISDIITNHSGTLDKFLGDGTMAIWGAPLYDRYQATNALATAFEIMKYFETTQLNIGIGVNTGTAILGQIGCMNLKSYTAIGDTVNLSSRIESLNKLYGTSTLLSEDTFERLKREPRSKRPDFYFREVDKVKVYGKRRSTQLYELVGLNPQISQKTLEGYNWFKMGISAYKKGDWRKAEQYFLSAKRRLKNKKMCSIYIDRCREFSISPPVGRWEGTISLSKF